MITSTAQKKNKNKEYQTLKKKTIQLTTGIYGQYKVKNFMNFNNC